MKNLIIIFNIVFLFFGSILFSNIHHHHDQCYTYEINQCEECINFENSNNYILDFHEVNFSNNNTNLFVYQYFGTIGFNAHRKYLSRAPPIS